MKYYAYALLQNEMITIARNKPFLKCPYPLEYMFLFKEPKTDVFTKIGKAVIANEKIVSLPYQEVKYCLSCDSIICFCADNQVERMRKYLQLLDSIGELK